MSEEVKKISAFKAFAAAQQTYAEAEEKAKQEAGTPRVERFRIGEDGEYSIRVLPLAPTFNDTGEILPMERKGYEYPIRQLFLTIEAPAKKGKTKKISIPVIRTTDKEVGKSIDLIDTYLKIAKEMYGNDDDLMELINGTSYNGGLRWNYGHAIMVLDVSSDKERAKGPQLWQCSHSQYKDLDSARLRLWKEELEEDEKAGCPISGLEGSYPVKIIRGNNNGKTEYRIEIGRKKVDLKEEEIEKLLELPRIPEQIYRYTKYQAEATVVFLQQYDEKHDMEVCKEPDFQEAVKTLMAELPADDNSHFDLAGAANKEGKDEEVTLDSLWHEYDNIADQDLSEKSDEYQELREKIRQFIEDNELDVRISRTKNNQVLLEEIEDAMDEKAKTPKKKGAEPEPEKTSQRAKKEESDEPAAADEDTGDSKPKEEPASEEAPAPRQRRPRPGSAADDEQKEEQQAEESEQPAPSEGEERRSRLRARRMR